MRTLSPIRLCVLVTVIASCPAALLAQTATAAAGPSTPEAVVAELYSAVSAPPGEKHDWPRFRALFAPGALLMVRRGDGSLRAMNVDEFVAESSKQEGTGFVERELVGRIEKYGHIAQVWSSYEATFGSGEAQRTIQGVNSFQLAEINGAWRILTIMWEATRSGGELPRDLTRPPGSK